MADKAQYIYWDSCAFIKFLNQEDEWELCEGTIQQAMAQILKFKPKKSTKKKSQKEGTASNQQQQNKKDEKTEN